MSEFDWTLLLVTAPFLSLLPGIELFWMFCPLIVTAAYETPPSATNRAMSDSTVAGLTLNLDLRNTLDLLVGGRGEYMESGRPTEAGAALAAGALAVAAPRPAAGPALAFL